MKLHFRILAALAALLMLVSVVACGDTGNSDTTSDTVASADSTIPESGNTDGNLDENGFLRDNLPADLKDKYNGKHVTVLCWNDVEHEEFEAAADGDNVLNSIYERNEAVQTQLGVEIEYIRVDGDSGFKNQWNSYVGKNVSVNEHAFDIIAGYSLSVALNATSGYLYNMLDEDCKYLDFDMPWWSSLLLSQATINNKLYFASGDISRNALEMMYVCYCNTQLLAMHNLENPQTFVESGDWTYEKFIEMCQGIYAEADGIPGKSASKTESDFFGYMTAQIHVDPWFYGCGATICEKNADGVVVPSESFTSERVINTLNMLQTLLYNSDDAIYTGNDTAKVFHQRAFGAGKVLFIMDRARVSHKILAAEYGFQDFVILPCPKYDKDQKNYITVMGNPFTLYAIPKDTTDPEFASAFIESFASQGYRIVTPAVFELSLKTRYTFDNLSSKMYDMIRENVTYDVGRIFSSDLIGQSTFRDAVADENSAWTSKAEAKVKQLKTLCTKFADKFAD
ncbi:MAG: hypothetical protein MJ102_00355 [Clostridia bacterium]|nr:hypothetical protein [Clostridia bacterium]